MKITNRKTPNCPSDYCVEWSDGTWIWVKNNRIVDCNDSLDEYKVNELLDYILR